MAASDPPFPLDAETREMIALLRGAAAKARALMLNPPGKTDRAKTFAASQAAVKLKQYNDELQRIKVRLVSVAAKKVASAYKNGIAVAEKQARDAGVVPAGSPVKGSFTLVDASRARVLAQQTVGDLSKAVDSMRDRTGIVVR